MTKRKPDPYRILQAENGRRIFFLQAWDGRRSLVGGRQILVVPPDRPESLVFAVFAKLVMIPDQGSDKANLAFASRILRTFRDEFRREPRTGRAPARRERRATPRRGRRPA